MKLSKKYIIGTHVMFYEVDMIHEFIQSVYNAVTLVRTLKILPVTLNLIFQKLLKR